MKVNKHWLHFTFFVLAIHVHLFVNSDFFYLMFLLVPTVEIG